MIVTICAMALSVVICVSFLDIVLLSHLTNGLSSSPRGASILLEITFLATIADPSVSLIISTSFFETRLAVLFNIVNRPRVLTVSESLTKITVISSLATSPLKGPGVFPCTTSRIAASRCCPSSATRPDCVARPSPPITITPKSFNELS